MMGDVYLAASMWVSFSIGMMVINKLAIRAFPLECTVVLLQMVFTLFVVPVVGWKSLHIGSVRDLLLWLRVAPFFAGVLLTSILALKDAPMSLVIVFRGLAPFIGLVAEAFLPDPPQITRPMIFSLIGMFLGVYMYARHMPGGSMISVVWVTLNNVFVIGDRLLQQLMLDRHQSPVDISLLSCTIINNLAGGTIMAMVAFSKDEFTQIPSALVSLDGSRAIVVGLTCVVAAGIGYSSVMLQSLVSATSFFVLATASKFAIILVEVCFMDFSLTASQIAGASVVITCGIFYGQAKENALSSNAEEKTPLVNATNNLLLKKTSEPEQT